jgi:hypothetical protein
VGGNYALEDLNYRCRTSCLVIKLTDIRSRAVTLGTTPYVTHFVFRPLTSMDISGVGTVTSLEAVGTTENLKGEKMLDKMSARCLAINVQSGDGKYIDGACVLADADGDKIFSTFDTRDVDKSQPDMSCGTHVITGGTGSTKKSLEPSRLPAIRCRHSLVKAAIPQWTSRTTRRGRSRNSLQVLNREMGARGAYLFPKYCMHELPLEAGLIAPGTTISGAAAETDQWRIVSKEPIDRWL